MRSQPNFFRRQLAALVCAHALFFGTAPVAGANGPSPLRIAAEYSRAVTNRFSAQQGSAAGHEVNATVGIVMPADVRPGDIISASVVLHPEDYDKTPALHVIRVDVPLETGDDGNPTLRGVVVDTGDGQPKPVDHGLHYKLPEGTLRNINRLRALLSRPGKTSVITKEIPLDPNPPAIERLAASTGKATDFSSPPAAPARGINVIRGPFGGDSANTQISVANRQVPVLAETPRSTYYRLPSGLPPGPNQVVLAEGNRIVSFDLNVIRLSITADKIQLKKGETTVLHVAVSGAQGLSPSAWRSGASPELVDPATLPALAPGFHPPGSNDAGVILLLVQNGSPGAISLERAVGQVVVLQLTPAQLSSGTYTFNDVIHAIRDGGFAVNAVLHIFLAPAPGQEAQNAQNPQNAANSQQPQNPASNLNPPKPPAPGDLAPARDANAAPSKPAPSSEPNTANRNAPAPHATPSQPIAYSPQRAARDKEIGGQFAPIFYEGMGDHMRSDYITNFDFDGDWRGDNNWDNVDNLKFHILGYVYFSVIETSTHFYVHYAVYHPRDYKGGLGKSVLLESVLHQVKEEMGGDPTGVTESIALSHENDLEGCLVVAEKHGEDPTAASVQFVETMAHNRYIKYHPSWVKTDVGEEIEMRGQHALMFVEPKGHGTEKYTGTTKQLKDCSRGVLIYSYTGHADDQEETGSRFVGYDLLPIYTTMWAHAQTSAGVNETYGEAYDFPLFKVLEYLLTGQTDEVQLTMGLLGVAFRGAVAFPNKARPPWGWYDMSERGRPRGEWFFDPAAVVKRHFHAGAEFSTAYTFNPYLRIATE